MKKTFPNRTFIFYLLFFILTNSSGIQLPGYSQRWFRKPVTNATIKIKLSILTDTSGFFASGSGTYLWEEEQTNVKTNTF
jgi:hypothetical protein